MLFNGNVIKTTGDRIVNKPLTRTLHLLSMDYKNMYDGTIPSIMMKQISEKNYDALISEIGNYNTSTIEPLHLDLNDERKMITTGGRSGGPLAAYIVNAVRGIIS